MKRLAICNLSFDKKVFLQTFLLFFALTSFFTKAYAVVDFSASVKSVSSNSVVLSVKNNVQSTVNNGDGSYQNMLIFSVSVIRNSDGLLISSQSFNSRGVEQKDISFTSLAQGTSYNAEFSVENKTTQEVKKGSYPFKTSGISQAVNILPVEFIKSLTVVSSNSISVTLKNKSTKTFEVSVDAKSTSTGLIDESKKISISPNSNANLYFTQLKNDIKYDLILSGKQQGSSTFYPNVFYNGLEPKGTQTPQTPTTNPAEPASQGGTQTYNPNQGGQIQSQSASKNKKGDGTCKDGLDNSVGVDANEDGVVDENEEKGDGKADYYGVDTDSDGDLDLEPDPSCIAPEGTEKADISNSNIISCYNFCTFIDLLKTINKAITFLITTLFVPTLVIVFMTAGVKYILAQGDSKKIVNLKNLIKNILIGVLLILCSWLIVKVILTVLVKDSDSALQFLE